MLPLGEDRLVPLLVLEPLVDVRRQRCHPSHLERIQQLPRHASAAPGGPRRRAPHRSRSAGRRSAAHHLADRPACATADTGPATTRGRARRRQRPRSPLHRVAPTTAPRPGAARVPSDRHPGGQHPRLVDHHQIAGAQQLVSSATVASSGGTPAPRSTSSRAASRGSIGVCAMAVSGSSYSSSSRYTVLSPSIIGGVGNRAATGDLLRGSEAHRAADDLLHDLGRAAVDRGDPGVGDRHEPTGYSFM